MQQAQGPYNAGSQRGIYLKDPHTDEAGTPPHKKKDLKIKYGTVLYLKICKKMKIHEQGPKILNILLPPVAPLF